MRFMQRKSSRDRERGLGRSKAMWAGLAVVFVVFAGLVVAHWSAAPATTTWGMGPAHASHSVTSAVRST